MSPQLGELILPPQSGSSAPTPLAHWKAVRGLTAARQVNVLFDGDSVAEGTAVATRDLRWQDKVIAALRTAYPSGAVGGEGYVPGEYVSSTMTDRFSTTGTTITGTYVNETGAAVGTKFGLGVRYLRLAAGATATITGICTLLAGGTLRTRGSRSMVAPSPPRRRWPPMPAGSPPPATGSRFGASPPEATPS
jgi:hypothetical protein